MNRVDAYGTIFNYLHGVRLDSKYLINSLRLKFNFHRWLKCVLRNYSTFLNLIAKFITSGRIEMHSCRSHFLRCFQPTSLSLPLPSSYRPFPLIPFCPFTPKFTSGTRDILNVVRVVTALVLFLAYDGQLTQCIFIYKGKPFVICKAKCWISIQLECFCLTSCIIKLQPIILQDLFLLIL